ncbi:hypothetical protein OSB04_031039 [Centaurea solstitialis]|uniref:TTF-type domain-containing protein n=1 Tax=Centaurea solstitialis TaxID=347529 RepID=A0AA38SLW5_9ASTR|nr:hypothetical protein OSB04_031039 [Centaurea solstitialis]
MDHMCLHKLSMLLLLLTANLAVAQLCSNELQQSELNRTRINTTCFGKLDSSSTTAIKVGGGYGGGSSFTDSPSRNYGAKQAGANLHIIMLRFYKKVGESSSSETPKTTNVEETIAKDNEQETPLKYMKVDLDSLPADPGQRPSMEVYHVNQRDEIRRHYLQKGPCQPRNHSFERREIGGRVRKFNPSWFDDHKYWLEYSVELEAAFCLCCYLFKTDLRNQGGADNFVKGGFKAWNKRERLDIHSNGGPHNLAVQKCQNLMKQAQSIATIFDKQTDSQKDKNRIKIYASIDCVRFLLRQGLPFVVIMKEVTQETKVTFLNFYISTLNEVIK